MAPHASSTLRAGKDVLLENHCWVSMVGRSRAVIVVSHAISGTLQIQNQNMGRGEVC
jgi:hypothetical protein